jgi:hypothetical protein|tara:strand:- start:108982 stop:109950 length:969 start_codon:yes stop_codon:yes gene_type:complete
MKIFTLLLFCAASTISFSQYSLSSAVGPCPGNLNIDPTYPNGGGMIAGWDSLIGPSLTTPTWSAAQTIPFAFNFDGAAVTSFKVSSTGVLTFDVGSSMAAPSVTAEVLPSANIPDKSVCVWGLETSGSNDMAHMRTWGAAPNRQHWIHYSSCANGTIAWSYLSIVLEETTNNIYVVDQRNTTGVGALTIGVQVNGTTATMVPGSPAVGAQAGTDPTSADDYTYTFKRSLAELESNEAVANLDVFPNPSAGTINVNLTLDNAQEVTYSLIDAKGNVVIKSVSDKMNSGNNTIKLDGDHLSNGVYMLNVVSAQGVSTKQVQILK